MHYIPCSDRCLVRPALQSTLRQSSELLRVDRNNAAVKSLMSGNLAKQPIVEVPADVQTRCTRQLQAHSYSGSARSSPSILLRRFQVPVLLAVDRYNALYAPAEYGQPSGEYGRRQLDPRGAAPGVSAAPHRACSSRQWRLRGRHGTRGSRLRPRPGAPAPL